MKTEDLISFTNILLSECQYRWSISWKTSFSWLTGYSALLVSFYMEDCWLSVAFVGSSSSSWPWNVGIPTFSISLLFSVYAHFFGDLIQSFCFTYYLCDPKIHICSSDFFSELQEFICNCWLNISTWIFWIYIPVLTFLKPNSWFLLDHHPLSAKKRK